VPLDGKCRLNAPAPARSAVDSGKHPGRAAGRRRSCCIMQDRAHRYRRRPARRLCRSLIFQAERGTSERSTVKSRLKGKRRSARRDAKIAAEADGGASRPDQVGYATSLGYSEEELQAVPADAVVSRGCGTPVALARLRRGFFNPRAFRHWAIFRKVVTRAARVSCTTGSRLLA
jgi:hypothetical protein